MQYVIGTLTPPLCYFVLPPACPFLPSTFMPLQSSSISSQENAEINPLPSSPEDKITVTKDDLLQEGYIRTKRAWTEEEDSLLMQLCKDENARFDEIARQIPGRNAKMCYSRYRRLTHQSKNSWSKAENSLLI